MILILSNKWDLTVDFVVRELRRRGNNFLRLNTEDLISEQATIVLPEFRLVISRGSRTYNLATHVGVIWNRRPGKPFDDVPASERPSLATQRFVNDQWYSWLEALQLLPDVVWINHPHANNAMESKIRQLWLASKVGFSIPTTIVSNDPDSVRSHMKRCGGKVIAKALYSPLIEELDEDFFIFTNELSVINSDDDEAIRLSPCIFQEPLIPKIDYRVTVIGNTVMPVRIVSEDESPVNLDWRTQKDGLKFCPCNLPSEIESLCRSYVKQCGLLFGAIDLVEHNGKFVFLEINPNGEWGWLQKPNGIPIAEALCDLMIQNDTERIESNELNH
jgi:glutathione synthase/RimK-type ligase-like ATP-grasp enzyme